MTTLLQNLPPLEQRPPKSRCKADDLQKSAGSTLELTGQLPPNHLFQPTRTREEANDARERCIMGL